MDSETSLVYCLLSWVSALIFVYNYATAFLLLFFLESFGTDIHIVIIANTRH